MPDRIYLSPPHMGPEELDYVKEAFDTNFIAPVGPALAAFEQQMADYLTRDGRDGEAHCVALSSGTAAIHLALRIAGVGPGDLVACSDLTFIGSASPVFFQGAHPAFIDSERRSWNMDPELAERWLDQAAEQGTLPRALVLVHLYGQAADTAPIAAACQRHGVELVEDAAESLGATYHDPNSGEHTRTGILSRFGILSFNGNKIITTGGGGMLVCRNAEDAEQARFLATQAREPAPHYEHTTIGYNYRLSNIAASIGRGQLEKIEARVDRRREIFDGYVERLGHGVAAEAIEFMPEAPWSRGNRWLTCCTLRDPRTPGDVNAAFELRERVRLALEAENIECRPVWKPMSMQPVYHDAVRTTRGVGEDLFTRGLCLPSGTALTDADQDRICETIKLQLKQ